jgi:hypothetical protein
MAHYAGTGGSNHDAKVMQQLRGQAIATRPAQLGIAPCDDFPVVYGAVMDWPVGEETATVVAFCDGNASLYTTSTFGVIGGVGHDSVRDSARLFVRTAAPLYDAAAPTSELRLPGPDRVQFYLLGFNGARLVDADLDAVCAGNDRLSDLFDAGQAVLTELRLVADSGSPNEPRGQADRGSSAGAYVNCLLTLMAEGIVQSVEIRSSAPVPDLEKLAEGSDEAKWVTEEGLRVDSVEPPQVILLLGRLAKVSGSALLARRGELRADRACPDGSRVPCLFDVRIGRSNRSATVVVAPGDDPRLAAQGGMGAG